MQQKLIDIIKKKEKTIIEVCRKINRAMVLKLYLGSESPGVLIKTQVAEPYPQSF